MPVTRAVTRKSKVDIAQKELDSDESEVVSSPECQEDTIADDIDIYVGNIQKSVTKMKKELQSLRKKNRNLREQLEAKDAMSKRPVNDSRARLSSASVKSLENTIATLQASNKKYRKQIDTMQAKELKAEAADLLVESIVLSEDERDTPQRMRKLLRSFSDLMLVTTLGEGEDETCPICLEKLKLKKCSSLTCEHLICEECLPKFSIGADETVQCPQCRRRCPREDLELIHMTESERWDQLLKVAQTWDTLDRRGGEETSGEEAEEGFITESSGTFSEHGQNNEDNEAEVKDESMSPANVKRQRLEQLAAERARKRIRR